MEKHVQRGEGADARSPRSSQEQAVLEAPNQELFSGETAALGARGRRGGGGSWAQNSGEETVLALVRRACRAAAGLFLSAASLVLAKWIPLLNALRL